MPTRTDLRKLLAMLRPGGASAPEITRDALASLPPAAKARAFREVARGRLRVDGAPERPALVSPAEVAHMTPAEKARRYRELVRPGG